MVKINKASFSLAARKSLVGDEGILDSSESYIIFHFAKFSNHTMCNTYVESDTERVYMSSLMGRKAACDLVYVISLHDFIERLREGQFIRRRRRRCPLQRQTHPLSPSSSRSSRSSRAWKRQPSSAYFQRQ